MRIYKNKEKPEITSGLTKEFEPGHILYGLNTPRDEAVKDLEKKKLYRKGPAPDSSKTLLSKFRKLLEKKGKKIIKRNILIQNDITNAVWDPLVNPTEYADDDSIKEDLHDYDRAIDFREFLSSHSKYNVKDIIIKSGITSIPSMSEGVPFWKKTSKAGLEYQLMQRKLPVHFTFSDISGASDKDNITQAADKNGKYGQGVTSSELRWLYRHKNTDEVKQNVKFWLDGKSVPHSEVFSEEKWSNYQPKNRYPKISEQ
ncbi:hypothetical protein [Xenorhabdus sp. PB30.3]|uniref:hypothetical protein n=1 Tax=Xenorhabdus sp. PB30.3 TaxID=2788941 RepID=UPI001E4007D1|nr:hypothetical protein [Xenorhabdus sp. PB30.3]MCC8379970.1 hypothetical protein [Xenorhabdus sp. PB30.3]